MQAVGLSGVAVINVENKANPNLISMVPISVDGAGHAQKIKMLKSNSNFGIVSLRTGNQHLMLIDFKDLQKPIVVSYFTKFAEKSLEHLSLFSGEYVFISSATKLRVVPLKSKVIMNYSFFEIFDF